MEASGIIFSEAATWAQHRRLAAEVMRKLGLTGPGLDTWLSRTGLTLCFADLMTSITVTCDV